MADAARCAGTNASEPGGSVFPKEFAVEPAAAREAAVATLSAGPVTPADAAGWGDRALIMRSCLEDGRLVQPDRPMVMLDEVYGAAALRSAARTGPELAQADAAGPEGEVWSTYASAAGLRWRMVFAAWLRRSATITPASLSLGGGGGSAPVVAYSLDPITLNPDTLRAQCFGESSPVRLVASKTREEFALWHFAPALGASGWALLGQISRHWVPVWGRESAPPDPQRVGTRDATAGAAGVVAINATAGAVTVTVAGEPGERVSLSFAPLGGAVGCRGGGALKTVSLACAVGAGGRAAFSLPEMACRG